MHLLMLGILGLIVLGYVLLRKRIAQSEHERWIRYGLATFLSVQLIVLIAVYRADGDVYLPFHLCSISYILTIVLLFTDNRQLFSYVFFTGIIGGFVTFLIPELDHAGWNRFRFYEFIIAHAMIMLVPLYYRMERGFSLSLKQGIVAVVLTNIIGFAMIPVNLWLDQSGVYPDANFMFVMRAPSDVETVFGPPPWHLFTFELVLIVTFGLLYLWSRWFEERRQASDTIPATNEKTA
jgi:hypothetical integral membrane protein (TIGR02206 family)